MQIHEIPGYLKVYWNATAKAVIDKWENYAVPLDDFRNSVLVKGLDHAKANGGVAWIVDSSTAKGAFSQEIQAFIGTDVFPELQKAGIKYFITVMPKSALTALTVKNYQAKAGPHGLTLVEVASEADALAYLAEQKKQSA
jgi:hypothetical protein